jgi:phosphoribosylglycinamide formyltransferase-1
VFSDRPGASALQRVPEIQRWSRDAKAYPSREAFDADLADAIAATNPTGCCAPVTCAFSAKRSSNVSVGALLNIHPSLLPKYRGLRTHARALQDGVREHGASVHFVTPELDAGAVIAQAMVPVAAGDTDDSLSSRVLAREHVLLLAVLRLAVTGRIAEREASVVSTVIPCLRRCN